MFFYWSSSPSVRLCVWMCTYTYMYMYLLLYTCGLRRYTCFCVLVLFQCMSFHMWTVFHFFKTRPLVATHLFLSSVFLKNFLWRHSLHTDGLVPSCSRHWNGHKVESADRSPPLDSKLHLLSFSSAVFDVTCTLSWATGGPARHKVLPSWLTNQLLSPE